MWVINRVSKMEEGMNSNSSSLEKVFTTPQKMQQSGESQPEGTGILTKRPCMALKWSNKGNMKRSNKGNMFNIHKSPKWIVSPSRICPLPPGTWSRGKTRTGASTFAYVESVLTCTNEHFFHPSHKKTHHGLLAFDARMSEFTVGKRLEIDWSSW